MASQKRIVQNVHEIYQEGENVNLIADAAIQQFDDVEQAVVDLKSAIQISTATGTELEDIANLFGISRESGESDTELRARILAYWPGFSGSGTIEDVKTTVARIAGFDESDITITEHEANKFTISFPVTDFSLIGVVSNVKDDIKIAGNWAFILATATVGTDTDIMEISETVNVNVVNHIYHGYYLWGGSLW